jgi:hypothetical protein
MACRNIFSISKISSYVIVAGVSEVSIKGIMAILAVSYDKIGKITGMFFPPPLQKVNETIIRGNKTFIRLIFISSLMVSVRHKFFTSITKKMWRREAHHLILL